MRSLFIVMMVFLVLGVGIAGAQSADESALRSRLDEIYTALNGGDLDSYLALYHEEVVYAVGNNVFVGRADVAAFEGPSFANGMQIEYSHQAIHLLSRTTAITHGGQVMTSATPPREGHVINTWVKVGEEWVVAAMQVAWASPGE